MSEPTTDPPLPHHKQILDFLLSRQPELEALVGLHRGGNEIRAALRELRRVTCITIRYVGKARRAGISWKTISRSLRGKEHAS